MTARRLSSRSASFHFHFCCLFFANRVDWNRAECCWSTRRSTSSSATRSWNWEWRAAGPTRSGCSRSSRSTISGPCPFSVGPSQSLPFPQTIWHLTSIIRSKLTGFHWVLLGFTGFYWVYWVLLGFTGFLLGFTWFYWVLLGFSGF